MHDPLSIYFEIPARDAMGRQHVAGKVRCLHDKVVVQYTRKSPAFRAPKNPLQTIELDYHDIEDVDFRKRWFGRSTLSFRVKDASQIDEMPGAEVGKALLQVEKRSNSEAASFEKLMDFKDSEFQIEEIQERLRTIEAEIGEQD